ncbi:MAG TPA: response regulator transcription factor [Anaerolineales bacterium]|nr:response regulator transcription factor [Anaerolineales bacterium]
MADIRVLIADDHPIVCKGIRNLLDPAVGIKVVGEASSGAQTLQMIEDLKPDVVLLDMELPDMNGVEVLEKISESDYTGKILGLSSYDDREYISQLLALGASGYLIKDEVPDTIVEAVRGVARGEKGWVSRRVAAKLSQMLQDEETGSKNLTSREMDVLHLVVDGKTNAEIAISLGISAKTVEKHLDSIYRKMGVASRVEAAVMAVRENFF